MEKIAMLDISESGRQIGKKLFAVLESKQKKELTQYIFERDKQSDVDNPVFITPNHDSSEHQGYPLTKIYESDLFFCLEQRIVCVQDQKIDLTAKEFDLLALLIRNPGRVFTFEMIMDLVWNEEDSFYSRKVIINHASNLRKKLRISDAVPDYIKSIRGVGYKFDNDCRETT